MDGEVPLPPEIQYGRFRPKGYYTQFRQWQVTPMSSNQYWNPDEIVRFLLTLKSGVMDPYRSNISFKVSTNTEMCPVGGLQVDNSAQGFIAQTVLSSNNAQIERITQYDTLAAYLTDIGFSEHVCQNRYAEGLGYSNLSTHNYFGSPNPTPPGQMFWQWDGHTDMRVQHINNSSILPTSAPVYPIRGGGFIETNGNFDSSLGLNGAVMQGSPVIINQSNSIINGTGYISSYQQNLGRLLNVRAQYMTAAKKPNYPDTNTSTLHVCPTVANQTWNVSEMTNISPTSGFNQKAPYQVKFSNQSSAQLVAGSSTTPVPTPFSVNAQNLGYVKPISAAFCRGSEQVMISPTIPQCQMQNGQILQQKVPVSQAQFYIPLISSICGILIPPDQFLLIPLQALYNLLLQITLSRFAMFTTGYSDVHEFDQKGMGVLQQRKWLISDMVWNIHLYTFQSQAVNQSITASLVKSIPISVTSYSLASQYQLPNGSVVRNSWNVGSQAQSLCELISIFLSNDYAQRPFCRKQFRCSNNVTSMQIKVNAQYYPSQPIVGNAGNPDLLDSTGNNFPFYKNILLSSNHLFSPNYPLPKINIYNFAINERCYNVANTKTFYDSNLHSCNINDVNWVNGNVVNYDTAMGMSSYHQNRYIGKAAYVYTWEPYGHSKQYMQGLNVDGVQNFNIIFNNLSTNVYPRDQTLLIFARYNSIVIYTQNGIKVIGGR